MGWGIGVGVGPLYYSKRLGGKRRRGGGSGDPGGAAGCVLLFVLLVALILVIKYWVAVAIFGAILGASWLTSQRRQRVERRSSRRLT
jgi:hypothetical protein